VVYFGYAMVDLQQEAAGVAKNAADLYRARGATSVDLVGHADTAEADPDLWREALDSDESICARMPAVAFTMGSPENEKDRDDDEGPPTIGSRRLNAPMPTREPLMSAVVTSEIL